MERDLSATIFILARFVIGKHDTVLHVLLVFISCRSSRILDKRERRGGWIS